MRPLSLRCLVLVAWLFLVAPRLAGAFELAGAVERPGEWSVDALKARPAVTQTVAYLAAGAAQARTYTGASLWSVLADAGAQSVPGPKNGWLRRMVVATGSDGYSAAFALAELAPEYGNRASLLAYAETRGDGVHAIDDDGPVRVTAPGDAKGGRYVSNLVRLEVRDSASRQAGSGGGRATRFEVSGAVQKPGGYDAAVLAALPAQERSAGGVRYKGVGLWELLNAAGLKLDPAVKNDVLHYVVVATGSDGYQALFALAELDPGFGGQPNLIAHEADGAPLGAEGAFRLVVPNDGRRSRWVANLVALEVLPAR